MVLGGGGGGTSQVCHLCQISKSADFLLFLALSLWSFPMVNSQPINSVLLTRHVVLTRARVWDPCDLNIEHVVRAVLLEYDV